ncbi:hypothetical protein EDB81DRAFT_783701, partial [Dactylonectria macrodidyma]
MDSTSYDYSWLNPNPGRPRRQAPPGSQAWPGNQVDAWTPGMSFQQFENIPPSLGSLTSNLSSRQVIPAIEPTERPSISHHQMPPPPPTGQSFEIADQDLTLASQRNTPAAKNNRPRLSDATWEAHKEDLRLHYLTKNKTLQETMAHMESQHEFHASRKMYTDRFKEWGFVKNLKRDAAKFISRARRKRGSKATKIQIGTTVLGEARVVRSIERHQKKENFVARDIPTLTNNPDILVATPAGNSNPSTPAGLQNDSAPAGVPITAGWTPSYATPSGAWSDTSTVRADWRNMSHDELRQLKLDAAWSYANGNVHDAEFKFRDALSGFRHRAGSTDNCTLKTAYQLASLYTHLSRMEDAKKVLQWALDSHVNKWSLDHPRTIAHLMQVVELHHSWSKNEIAVDLIREIFGPLTRCSEKEEPRAIVADDDGDVNSENDPQTQGGGSRDDSGFNDQNETIVDSYLHLEGVWLEFHSPTTEQLLNYLITQCERHPQHLTIHALKARLMLLKLHEKKKQLDTALTVAKDVLLSILQVVSEQDGLPLLESLEISIELAFFYLENGSPENCEKIISWLATKLERGIAGGYHYNTNLASAALFFMIQVACKHYQRDGGGWGDASPWFERAYGLRVSLEGPGGLLAKSLENIIKTRGLGIRRLAISLELTDLSLSIL